ncbi:hypothetical protein FOL46_008951 [Perkinsus olseni]|uniref:Maltose/galactoside acetyltransferase domain-containing protein n=1 Tax=Perkinsus olseni TaxID=32597 RepID=A0A7J6L4M0_PEROL|nr:hypothetical protein FOL46_008951 [Perkinsus olseni]
MSLKIISDEDNRERMTRGELYLPMKEGLIRLRAKAKKWCREYNATDDDAPDFIQVRERLLKDALGSCGKGAFIEPPFRCDYAFNIHIGDGFYANYDLVILDACPVRIGNNVFFGPGVHLYAVNHPRAVSARTHFIEDGAPITIGDDAWIGGRTVVLPGVTIGTGCIIGAGSVVTKVMQHRLMPVHRLSQDIPAGMIAAGNPCKAIREAPDEPTEEEKRFLADNNISYVT